MVRVVDVFLTHEGEDHIVSVKVARRFKGFVALEFHALAQMEGINLAILAYLPAFRQARHQLRGSRFKIHQTVIDRHRAGIHAGARGIQLRIEIFR